MAVLVLTGPLVAACGRPSPEAPPSVSAEADRSHPEGRGTFFDPEDTAALVEWASHVTIARIDARLGSSTREKVKEVQYRASVLEALKGGLSGEITINVLPSSDYSIEGQEDLDPLDVGMTYVFVSRPRPGKPWHTVEGAEAARLVESATHLAELRAEFLTAIKSQ